MGKNGNAGPDLWESVLEIVEELRQETKLIREAALSNERSFRKLARTILEARLPDEGALRRPRAPD